MTARSMALPARPAVRECERPPSYWRRARAVVNVWRQRLRSRQELVMLDDRALRDVGLTRYDALQEARKPFWRE
jgi:uncharacterized protein YjiS (DUF1127 family)